MRTVSSVLTVLATTATLTFFSNAALADESPASPAAKPESATPANADVSSTSKSSKASETGVSIQVGLGAQYLFGSLSEGAELRAIGNSFELRGAYHFTRHFGAAVGIQGIVGKVTNDCEGDGCPAVAAFRLPVTVEYAFDRRQSGAYVAAGLSPFNRYAVVNNTDGRSFSMTMSSPVEWTASFGYRIPVEARSIELGLGFNMGQYTHISVSNAGKTVEGDVLDDKLAMHYMASLFCGFNF